MVHETINAPVNHPSSDIYQVVSVNRPSRGTLKTSFIFTKAKTNASLHQLIDRGANGCLAGSGRRVLNCTRYKIYIVGSDIHGLTRLDVVTASSLLDTNQGKAISIFNEYAFLGKENSIHSPDQMEYFKTRVDDKPIKLEASNDWRHWKHISCPSFSWMAWHTSKPLAGLMTKSLKLIHMSSSPHQTLGNLPY